MKIGKQSDLTLIQIHKNDKIGRLLKYVILLGFPIIFDQQKGMTTQ